ncbi:MAG: BON domain-containing protein [Gammaproteobacteria bacterium]|nr:MAG: BON domain-containing protein [Gammaproteobacteria bacterium]RKZ96140.1 MAG: BON domain-containing protein [Gammaproteobacteria bacterium]
MQKFKFILLLIIPIILLQGCAAAVVTGAATGVAMAHDRRTSGSIIDDQGVEFKASSAIYENKEIHDQSNINITSYNGVVLISGETVTEDFKQQITAIVKAIPKVKYIHNELIIAAPSSLPSRSSDSWITTKVKTKLATDEDVDPFYIKVVTEHGVVYLMGIVSHEEADRVVAIVTKADGVQRVVKIFEYTD